MPPERGNSEPTFSHISMTHMLEKMLSSQTEMAK